MNREAGRGSSGDEPLNVVDAADVALGAIDDEARVRLEQMLGEAHPTVRAVFEAEVDAYREVLARVTADLETEPPAGLRGRVLASIRSADGDAEPAHAGVARSVEDRSDEDRHDTRRTARSRPPGVRVPAAAAAVAVLFGSGLAVGRLTAPEPAPVAGNGEAGERIRTLLAPDDLSMEQRDLAGGGQVAVMYAPSVRLGTLVVTGVGAPPAGHHMAVWHADPGSPARPAATMGGPGSGAATSAMLGEVDAGDVLVVTVEADGAEPDAPTGQVLAEIDLR